MMTRRTGTLVAGMVAMAVIASGCSVVGTLGATEEVSCYVGGGRHFAKSYVDGPEMAPDQFRTTPQGAALEAFFVGGDGEVESGPYAELDGFSVVSDSYVLGYRDGLPIQDYVLDGDDVQQWGGCSPTLVHGDRVAGRWHPVQPVNPDSTTLPIRVEGGACVEPNGTNVITEVVSIDVTETAETVEIVVWTREKQFTGMCAGVGIELDATAELTAPVGDRVLLNTGIIPPAAATER
jgi:hypothetical protein